MDKQSHRNAQQTNAATRQLATGGTGSRGRREGQQGQEGGAGEEAAASWLASAIATIFLANLAMT